LGQITDQKPIITKAKKDRQLQAARGRGIAPWSLRGKMCNFPTV
jgi:hypothetical protein